MRRLVIVAVVAAAASGAAVAVAASAAARAGAAIPPAAATESLMQADRDFLAAASEKGIDGWMSFMAVDAARMPAIGGSFVSGHENIRVMDGAMFRNPDARLVWEPDSAYLFADGRHGLTTGPYEVRASDGTVMASGHYLTFWRLEGERWKVIFDTGAAERP